MNESTTTQGEFADDSSIDFSLEPMSPQLMISKSYNISIEWPYFVSDSGQKITFLATARNIPEEMYPIHGNSDHLEDIII